MQVTGTTSSSPTDDRPQGDPDGFFEFDSTPLQLKTLVERGSVKPDDRIYFLLLWDQPGFEEVEGPDGDTVTGPGPTDAERIPGVIRDNIAADVSDRLGGAEVTNNTVDATAMAAPAEAVVRELADSAISDRYDEIEKARIVAIQAARPAQSEPPPPPEQVPEAEPQKSVGSLLAGPTPLLIGGGLAGAAWLAWKNMSLK